MSANKSFVVGGAGTGINPEDVFQVAYEDTIPLVLDPSAAERIKKESPTPKQLKLLEPHPSYLRQRGKLSSAPNSQLPFSSPQARAVLFTQLYNIMEGNTKIRLQVAEFLRDLLNSKIYPEFVWESCDKIAVRRLLTILYGEGSMSGGKQFNEVMGEILAPKLSLGELVVIENGSAVSAAISSLCIHALKVQLESAVGIVGLTMEALRASTNGLKGEIVEASQDKMGIVIADQLRSLLQGSNQVNFKKSVGNIESVTQVHFNLGSLSSALQWSREACRAELQRTYLPPNDKNEPQQLPSQILPLRMKNLAAVTLQCCKHSLQRSKLLLQSMSKLEGYSNQALSYYTQSTKVSDLLTRCKLSLQELETMLFELSFEIQDPECEDENSFPGLICCKTAQQTQETFQAIMALEALLSTQLLHWQQQTELNEQIKQQSSSQNGNEASDSTQQKQKQKKGKGGNAGFVIGKGSEVVWSYFRRTVHEAENNGNEAAGEYQRVLESLNPSSHELSRMLSELKAEMEANATRRKPKLPKGTRDFLPKQMSIREEAFATIQNIFRRHGAVNIDTPVFELKETLTGKYGEDSKLIYDLADQGGEILSLRYDLTVPFARYVALQNVGNIKRYHIGKVYRRDQPQTNRGRFREFYQCDFDIAGYAPSAPDAEVLKVLTEILDELQLGDYEVKVNHRELLDSMMDICGVPSQKFRPICSAIDKLDKEPWEVVKREMVEDKGLDVQVADKLGEFVKLSGEPFQLLQTLQDESHPFAQHQQAANALNQMKDIFSYLQEMEALERIKFDMSLARGLDYYTGVIYEAVLKGANVGSIAAGGRYDGLVGMFSGKDIPAVGVSIGIERVFNILEERTNQLAEQNNKSIRATKTQALVASIGKGLQKKRMQLAAALWKAGIACEFGFKADPKMGDNLNYVFEQGIPFMVLFGEDEVEKGTVKIKDIGENEEREIQESELVEILKGLIGKKGNNSILF